MTLLPVRGIGVAMRVIKTEGGFMNYTTAISLRRRGKKPAYIARLMYADGVTGLRKEKSKSAKSRSEAKRLIKELEEEFATGGQTAVESDEMTFAELAKHCQTTKYCEAQYDAEEFFGKMKLRDIKVIHLRGYRNYRLGSKTKSGTKVNVATVNREMSTLRAVLNEAMVNDWIVVNPFSKARHGELITTADERKRETILTAAEEQRLLKACEGETRRHLRALVIAALDTGARQGELLNLHWYSIDFDEGVIKDIVSYKGRKGTIQTREVPLTARLKSTLLELQSEKPVKAFRKLKSGTKPAESLVFGITDNVKRSWSAAREKAGLLHVRFHDLRHTFATRLAQSMQLVFVGQMLGHSNPKTTNRYVNRTREVTTQAGSILDSWQQEQESRIRIQQSAIEAETVN
jgi:integrase